MVNYEEINYKSFGRCMKIDNGTVEAIITLDIGPRIIKFSTVGGENIFFEDDARVVNHDHNLPIYKEKFGDDAEAWAILGGHRVWTSPEALPRSYYPSCKSECEKIENGVRIIAPLQTWTYLEPIMEITIIGDNEVKVVHRVKNMGAWDAEFSVWALSVSSQGGEEIIPWPDKKTGLLHNRLMALWDYTDMADERVTWGSRYIRLRQDNTNENAFKFGLNMQNGYSMYFNHGDLFVKKFDVVEDGSYPDGGMNFETYTNEHFLEIESLGELKSVSSGEENTHTEYWKIFSGVAVPQTDEEIDKIVEKYV